MSEPRLLDLFCGAGGAGMGYHRAGFEVVGVDNRPMPRYPFEFHQADALDYCAAHGREFDVIHASPPCQRYSGMSNCIPGLSEEYPDLLPATRRLLQGMGKPYVIENVSGAQFTHAVMLCGSMFPELRVYRHRWFECNPFFLSPGHGTHRDSTPRAGYGISPKGFISVSGHMGNIEYVKTAMGIDWMTGDELSEAIPPAYTEYIGRFLMAAVLVSQ